MGIKKKTGFSLIELMVALAVAMIVLTVAVPNMQSMVRDNRLAAYSNQLLSALSLARNEAVKRGQWVTVCKADTSAAQPMCDMNACSGVDGSDCWEKGWIVFSENTTAGSQLGVLEDNGNGIPCEAGEECLIRAFDPLPQGFTLRVGSTFARWVSYDSMGKSQGSGGLGNDTFKLCQGEDLQNARSIVLNRVGRASVRTGAGTTCS